LAADHAERQDWTYRAARRRMLKAGRAQLPRHNAVARMDRKGNRIVDCGCGWSGNGLGWAGHLEDVVRQAISAGLPA
jgi:ubiquinone/menaquinone biosynthesis C-methylase UbiE